MRAQARRSGNSEAREVHVDLEPQDARVRRGLKSVSQGALEWNSLPGRYFPDPPVLERTLAGPCRAVLSTPKYPGKTGPVATGARLWQRFPPGGASATRSISLRPGNCRHGLTPCDPDPSGPRGSFQSCSPLLSVSLSSVCPGLGVGIPAKKSPGKGTPV